jgi:hypothetical protein
LTGHMPSDLLVQNAKYSWDITATKCVISSLDQVTVGVVHDDPLSRRCSSDGDEFDVFRRVERNQRAAAPTAITAVATSIHRPIEMLPLVGGGAISLAGFSRSNRDRHTTGESRKDSQLAHVAERHRRADDEAASRFSACKELFLSDRRHATPLSQVAPAIHITSRINKSRTRHGHRQSVGISVKITLHVLNWKVVWLHLQVHFIR